MRRLTGTLLFAATVGAGLAMASVQPPATGDQRPHLGPGGPPPGGPMGRPPIERVLQLTDEQQQQLKASREQERQEMQPLLEQMRPLHEQLRSALESGANDANAVGTLVLDLYALQQKMKQVRDAAHERLIGLLTAKQKEQLNLLEQMMGPGAGGPGHGPGMLGPLFGPPPLPHAEGKPKKG